MNRLRLEIVDSTSPTVRRGKSADLRIDGDRLVDLVREVKLPFASSEGHPEIAGRYQSLAVDVVAAPSMHLLGEPNAQWTDEAIANHDPPRPAILRSSDSGLHEDWGLFAEIVVEGEVVIWREFENPHRTGELSQPWSWDELGEFVFDRVAYEKALSLTIDD